MNTAETRLLAAALLAIVTAPAFAQTPDNQLAQSLPLVTVTGTREKVPLSETPASVGIINAQSIRQTAPTHPQQILGQVPGVAVAVTNGEGHTTSIRHPFTTSPLYLFLEDGLPIRATGFFNHNALYELNLPMAGGIEVVRGPGTALYGSDAIGGIVNMLTRAPSDGPGVDGAVEIGSFGWRRLMVEGDTERWATNALRADLNVTHSDGWRNKTAYDRQSANLRLDTDPGPQARLKTVLAGSKIDQETGANSPLIYSDYVNDPKRNNFPIAFRKVEALRLSSNYDNEFGDGLLSVTPYLRDNSMDLRASFLLSSDPTISYSANRSYGVLAKYRQDFPGRMRARLIGGVDIDISPGDRQEDRLNVTVSGAGASRVFSDYTVAGRIYDYDVTFTSYSPYLHGEISPLEALRVTAGVRYDALSYELDNHRGPAPVQAGGANFYGQVASTTVNFDRVSPRLGATYAISASTHLYASYNTGFRVPSESQLFRPSVSANTADASNKAALAVKLKPIKAAQVELGIRGEAADVSYNAVVFDLRKRDDLVSQRDLATNVSTSVNAGRTEHRGIEVGVGSALGPQFRLDAALSYTKHEYVNWVTATSDFSGKEIESGPRELANVRLAWTPRFALLAPLFAQLEWTRVGSYWLEASNSPNFPKYPGHDLLNARAAWRFSPAWSAFLRVYNATDRRYADSAQVSSNTPVYSPGLPRAFYVGGEAKW